MTLSETLRCLAHALYDLLGDEIKMGPVMLTPEAGGGGVSVEGGDHVSALVLVFPVLQQALPVGNRCIQRGTRSGAFTKAG